MDVSGDEVAEVVLNEFHKWPQKRKPLVRGNGVLEWVSLSGIVAQVRGNLTCISVATGMKCLPQNKISRAQGIVLHDWHAEILAIRSLNRFLLEECYALALSQKQESEYVRLRGQDERTKESFQPFALHDGIKLHMYCSEAPCGDASMELTMAAQEDATPWELPPKDSDSSSLLPSDNPLHGRGYFSSLGSVRRKPSRPDAPPTLSKSCSDKLSLKQSTSILSSLTSLIISPRNAYLHTLTLPESQFSVTACTRSFSPTGRLSPLSNKKWEGGYAYTPFSILTTTKEYSYSRRQTLSPNTKLVPSSISTAHSPLFTETTIGGTLQGRKQFSIKGASLLCKKSTWKLALEIVVAVSVPVIEESLRAERYRDVKEGELLEGRRKVKGEVRDVLKGWVMNEGDEEWGLGGEEK